MENPFIKYKTFQEVFENEPLIILDHVLWFLNDNYVTPADLYEFIGNCPALQGLEYEDGKKNIRDQMAVIDKLIKDGYVKKEEIGYYDPEKKFFESASTAIEIEITFEGIIFYKNGGYVKQKIAIEAESQRISALEESNYRVSVWVAIGAIGILIIEIGKICAPFLKQWYYGY